jgi:hypothetical protein
VGISAPRDGAQVLFLLQDQLTLPSWALKCSVTGVSTLKSNNRLTTVFNTTNLQSYLFSHPQP